MIIKNFLLNENELKELVKYLSDLIQYQNKIVLLQGDLASGKTTLVKKYVDFLKLNDIVTSPTFSLQTTYSNNIYHYDLYNKTLQEFIALGLLEEFEKDGIHFIEWGDDKLKQLLKEYGFDIVTIKINKMQNKREYKIES